MIQQTNLSYNEIAKNHADIVLSRFINEDITFYGLYFDFSAATKGHQALYDAMLYCTDKSLSINVANLTDAAVKLKIIPQSQEAVARFAGMVGNKLEYLGKIQTTEKDLEVAEKQLDECAKQIRLAKILSQISLISDEAGSVDEKLLKVETLLAKTQANVHSEMIVNSKKAVETVRDHNSKQLASGKGGIIPTGFSVVDSVIGGFPRGEISIIGARPRVGKTAFLLQVCTLLAEHGYLVAFASLEMSVLRLMQSGYQHRLGWSVKSQAMNQPFKNTDILDDFDTWRSELSLYFVHMRGPSPAMLMSALDRIERIEKRPVDAIFVDHLRYIATPEEAKNLGEVAQVGAKTYALKMYALERNIAIIVAAHLNRDAAAAGTLEPKMEHLKGSGMIEEDAGLILLMDRESLNFPLDKVLAKQAKFHIVKNRMNAGSVINLGWNTDRGCFIDAIPQVIGNQVNMREVEKESTESPFDGMDMSDILSA